MPSKSKLLHLKVLMIEDSVEYAKLVKKYLSQAKIASFDFKHVEDFKSGKEQISKGSYDIILLDLELPDSQGLDTFLSVEKLFPEIPVVILTATDDDEMAVKAVQQGAQNYLVKEQVDHRQLERIIIYAHERHHLHKKLNETALKLKNLTDIKKKEIALKKSELRYKTLIEHIPSMLARFDKKQGKYTFWNRSEEWTGKTIDEWNRLSPDQRSAFIHPNDLKKYQQVYTKWSESDTREPLHYEFRLKNKDGGYRWLECLFYKESSLEGEHISTIQLSQDITGRKDNEAELKKYREQLEELVEHRTRKLKESEETAAAIINSSYDPIFLVDIKGTILAVNRAFAKSFNKEVHELFGTDIFELLPPNVAKFRKTRFREVIKRGRTVEFEDKRDGRDFHTIYFPIFDEDLNVKRVAAFIHDITEQRQLEEQLRQAQKMEAVGRLAGGIAHDFNNLLTVINGNTQLILMNLNAKDPIHDDIVDIQRASERATELTRQLLAFGRKQTLRPRVLNLNKILTNLKSMLQRMIGEDIELTSRLARNLWRVKVDPGQIEQVIINLAINSRDAMSEGGKITLQTLNIKSKHEFLAAHPEMPPGDYIMLRIMDNGTGMTKEIMTNMFDPFFTTKETGKGTGLGLSTVFGIVRQSSGYIFVESKVGEGTTINILFPAAKGKLKDIDAKKVKTTSKGGKESILVVEDEDAVRSLTVRSLERLGYNVKEAATGEDAYKLCKRMIEKKVERRGKLKLDLIITDVVMPGMRGPELIEKIRKDFWKKIRVLYISGYADSEILPDGVVDENIHFLLKPFDINDLTRKVRELLDN